MSLHCLFFKNLRIKEEVINVHSQNTILIVVWLNDVFGNNDFLERIVNLPEWSGFLRALCLIRQRICRLNIVSGRTKVADKIHLQIGALRLSFLILCISEYSADIYVESSYPHLIVYEIFHQVAFFILSKVDTSVTQSQIHKIIFIRRVDISFAFYIVASGLFYNKRIT